MGEIYRGHEIVIVVGAPSAAVIVDRETGLELPIKITAEPEEQIAHCLGRARQLVDLYLDPPSPGAGAPPGR